MRGASPRPPAGEGRAPPRHPSADICASKKREGALDRLGFTAYLGPIMAVKHDPNSKVIAENRRARFDYAIESDLEAGIMLLGSEVKSLRKGQSNIAESYASVEGGELWLINSYIAPYMQAGVFGHEERRRRKLLVSRKELSRLWQAVGREGMTLVPLVMYFNDKGMAKLKIGVAKGKKLADKRATEAKRDWDRQKSRIMKQGHQ
ncbi:SsrA-binding protein [Frigidibacter mobilis]|uniref:SsrA-binding protein n=2 Tax=Frigidibacter mobilis TaxID=1335048 RepID=A0A161GJ34_9RHOB|nr:SsrA-binding protein [Frigidibacter mobilis]